MEFFGALPKDPLKESLKTLKHADIYIGIIGTRYGSKDHEEISITRREYEEAYRLNKTILIYIIDDGNHPVLPKFVDTGKDAKLLAEFKSLLKERHTCATFISPQDLAIKVGVDIIHYLDLINEATEEDYTSRFSKEFPKFLSDAGYSLGMSENIIDLSGILEVSDDNKLVIRDASIKEVLVAGYLAINVNRGNLNVLRRILTIDPGLWRLFVKLTQHYGVKGDSIAKSIDECQDPMLFRLLVGLAGNLSLSQCAEPICRRLLARPALDTQFAELREQVTPIPEMVRNTLNLMPTTVLPVVEKYLEIAKRHKKWRQKQVFESVAKQLRNRLEEGDETPY